MRHGAAGGAECEEVDCACDGVWVFDLRDDGREEAADEGEDADDDVLGAECDEDGDGDGGGEEDEECGRVDELEDGVGDVRGDVERGEADGVEGGGGAGAEALAGDFGGEERGEACGGDGEAAESWRDAAEPALVVGELAEEDHGEDEYGGAGDAGELDAEE